MNTRVKVGTTRPGTTRNRPQMTRNVSADSEPASRRRSALSMLGRMTARLEVGAGLEGEHDPGERAVELVEGHRARTLRRIVDPRLAVVEALEHDEVVEVPEQDHGKLELVEVLDLVVLEALGLHAELTRALDQVARLAAVARHAALDAQLLERDPAVVTGHDHRRAPRRRTRPPPSAGWSAPWSVASAAAGMRACAAPRWRRARSRPPSRSRCGAARSCARPARRSARGSGSALPRAQPRSAPAARRRRSPRA